MSAAIKSTTKEKYYEAIGRRKTAAARIRLTPASRMSMVVNAKPLDDYFKTEELRVAARRALENTPLATKFAISAKVRGGGIHGQAEAVAHGVARALTLFDRALRLPLKKAKFLTRDSRMKERRKFGLKKARKSPQWAKR